MSLNFNILFVMVVMMLSDIAIITVKDVDYRCIIHKIDKYEAINF